MRTVLGLVGPPQLGGVCKGNRKGGSPSTRPLLLSLLMSPLCHSLPLLSYHSHPPSLFLHGRQVGTQVNFWYVGVHP